MNLKEKAMIVVLGILIFVAIGANMCTFYSTGAVDLFFAFGLGILVFVEAGVVICSYNNSKLTKAGNI